MIVLCIDPGLATFGWAVLDSVAKKILAMGVITTEPSAKKRKVLAADDNSRRVRELSRAVHAVFARWGPNIIAAESMSFPRSSSSACKVGMAWGVILHEAETRGLPLLQASPQEVKNALCGAKNASKADVRMAVIKLTGKRAERFLTGVPAGLHEHPWDAAGVGYACLDSEIMRFASAASVPAT